MKKLLFICFSSFLFLFSCSDAPPIATDSLQNEANKIETSDPIIYWELNSDKDMYWHFSTPVRASGTVYGILNGNNVSYSFSNTIPLVNVGPILPVGFIFQSYYINYVDPNRQPLIPFYKSGPINEYDIDLYDYNHTFKSQIVGKVANQAIYRWSTLNLYVDILQPERFYLTIQIFRDGNLYATLRNNQYLVYTWGNGWQRIKRLDNNYTFNYAGNYEIRYVLTSNYFTSIRGTPQQYIQTQSAYISVTTPD